MHAVFLINVYCRDISSMSVVIKSISCLVYVCQKLANLVRAFKPQTPERSSSRLFNRNRSDIRKVQHNINGC